MNLLPKDTKDFGSVDYWNNFFTKQKSQKFEWYGEYDSLSEVLDKYIHPKDQVLIIGCGSSKLSSDLYDVGIYNSMSIDISVPVITQMKEKYGRDRPKMRFENMDVFQLKLKDEDFSVVIDKGTLDALMIDGSEEISNKINKMFSEIERVLRYGGRYLCFSLLQEHILKKVLDWFTTKGWMIRFHRCSKAEAKHNDSLAFPIYAIVFTKMKQIPGLPMVLELVHDGTTAPKRCNSERDVIEYVKNAQHYAFLKHYLSKKKVVDDDICLELCSPDTGAVKYRMFVVDRREKSNIKFAVFVVPQGREIEWLFATPEGRQVVAANANCERIIVVHLLRNNIYESLEEVKNDLSQKVLELAPTDIKSQVPILSLGDDVGKREIKCRDRSQMSGEYVVEDVVSDDNEMFRRLIFLDSPYLVQSEIKLVPCPKKTRRKKGPPKLQIDFDYLACNHHAAMILGLTFLKSNMLNAKLLIIGLGGGILPTYLHKRFPDCSVDVVELDGSMLDVAKTWFELSIDERLRIHIGDGIKFIHEAVNKDSKYDAVILDVDNKDTSLGLSSPPEAFLETDVLKDLKKMASDTGIIMLNLACRNVELRKKVQTKLKSVFTSLFSRKIPAQVNEVIYCNNFSEPRNLLVLAKENYRKLISFIKTQTPQCDVDMLSTDLDQCLTEIT